MDIKYFRVPDCLIVVVLALVLSFEYAIAQQIELTTEEKQWVADHPVIRAAGGTDFVPIQFIRNGDATGFSVDYLNLITSKIGINVEYLNGFTWNQHIEKIYNKELDIISSISQSPERAEYLNFSSPYMHFPFVFYGRTGSDPINNISDLEGKRIGAINGWSSTEGYKKNYPQLNLIEQENATAAILALSDGSIDVFMVPSAIANYIIRQNFITNLEVIGKRLGPETKINDYLQLGVRNDWPILSGLIKKAQASLTSQEKQHLLNKWQVTSSTSNINLTPEEEDWIYRNRTIRVAADPTAAPMELIDSEGKISGIAGDYLDIISEKLGIQFEWAGNNNWAEGIEMIGSGQADMFSVITETQERKKEFDFTSPYLSMTNVIFNREGDQVYGSLETLRGHRVAQVSGSAIAELLKADYPDIEIVEATSMAEALRMVSIGKAEAYIGGISAATYHISDQGLTQIIVVGETPYKNNIAMAVRKDMPILSSIMKKAIDSFTPREKTAISRNWLSLKIEQKPDYTLIRNIIIIAVVILVINLLWINNLRREVKQRKRIEAKLVESQKNTLLALDKAEAAQAEAVAANIAKSNFLANMSHEIRTPLNAIIGFSEAMLAGLGGKIMSHKHKEYLNDIKTSGDHLAIVINDILDLSKIEAGKWRISEANFLIVDCIYDAVKVIKNKAVEKKLNLEIEIPDQLSTLTVFGDEVAIRRALINLLSNAVKYTKEKGNIICHARLCDNGSLEIEIKDTGIGIPDDRLEVVLNPFEQCETTYEIQEEGTGLGLPIVKRLIELHGGEFSLSSKVNAGTSAIIIIPAVRVFDSRTAVPQTIVG